MPRVIDPWIGTLFGNYRAVRKLGEGGMGVVYEAEHQKIGHRAAVKILKRELALDEEYAQRFLNEARAVNIIRHPGLVEIFDYGKLPDGTLFYVMEFLQGASLASRMEDKPGGWPAETVVELGLQVAKAIGETHAKGVIHRDLKPENFMLVKDPVRAGEERLKVLDFGIAKLTVNAPPESGVSTDKTQMQTLVGSMMGTPRFMAPEQWGQAESVDGRADVFALGVTLYSLLAGKPPYEGSSMSLLTRQPVPLAKVAPTAPQRLASLVDRMMQVSAAQRPTMAEVAAELSALAPRRLRSRELLIFGLLVGVILGALLLFGGGVLRKRYTKPGPDQLKELALGIIKQSLADRDPGLRLAALRALRQSADPSHRLLLEASLKDTKAEVVAEAAHALGNIQARLSRNALLDLLTAAHDPRVRIAAANGLAQLGVPIGIRTLQEIADGGEREARIEAALFLVERGEMKAADMVWPTIANRAALDLSLLSVVLRLADARFQPAVERLRVELARQQDGEARCRIAFHLAKAGDEDARQFLRKRFETPSAKAGSPSMSTERLLAASLLAGLREPIRAENFRSYLRPDSIDDSAKLAIGGLAYGGIEALGVLGEFLRQTESFSLRVAAAGAILQLLADSIEELESQKLKWAEAALQSDSVAAREGAVALYDLWESDQAIDRLVQAQKDEVSLIRERAVRALGRRNTRTALRALASTLRDPDASVRDATVEAMRAVVESLRQNGDGATAQLVREQLISLSTSPDETDRVAASGLLALFGDGSRRDALVAGLNGKNPRTRRLAVEFVDALPAVFVQALKDADLSVRLAAARRLAALDDERGLSLLRSTVASGDIHGVQAFTYLLKLKQDVVPPPDLSELLKSGELPTRFAIVDLILELSVAEATPLLKLACQDPAAVVRGRAARVAGKFFIRSSQLVFLDMVRLLRGDPEAYVRAQAAKQLKLLDETAAAQQPSAAPDGDAQTSPHVSSNTVPSNGATDMSVALPTTGSLSVKAEDGIRFYVDADPKKYEISNRQPMVVPLRVGTHSVQYRGGRKEVQIRANEVTSVELPIHLADQLIGDGNDALARNELDKAKLFYERAGRSLRGQGNRAQEVAVALGLARASEKKSGLTQNVLSLYNDALAVPEKDRTPEANLILQRELARITPKVARVRTFSIGHSGKCEPKETIYLPGEKILNQGNGKTEHLFLRAGQTLEQKQCGN